MFVSYMDKLYLKQTWIHGVNFDTFAIAVLDQGWQRSRRSWTSKRWRNLRTSRRFWNAWTCKLNFSKRLGGSSREITDLLETLGNFGKPWEITDLAGLNGIFLHRCWISSHFWIRTRGSGLFFAWSTIMTWREWLIKRLNTLRHI